MLEPQHAGYRSQEHYKSESTAEFKVDALERIVRVILVICFMGVLSLEIWLLVSTLGSG